jgi:hypothetical protein
MDHRRLGLLMLLPLLVTGRPALAARTTGASSGPAAVTVPVCDANGGAWLTGAGGAVFCWTVTITPPPEVTPDPVTVTSPDGPTGQVGTLAAG